MKQMFVVKILRQRDKQAPTNEVSPYESGKRTVPLSYKKTLLDPVRHILFPFQELAESLRNELKTKPGNLAQRLQINFAHHHELRKASVWIDKRQFHAKVV